jgi:sugar phosphate isomerase/epimerase
MGSDVGFPAPAYHPESLTGREIRIGFSMHPRWTDRAGLKAFIDPLRRAGLSALEFELDDHLDCWSDSPPLMEAAVEQGLELSFHAPYRSPHSLVGFAGDRRPDLEQEYRPLLEIAEGWARRSGKPRTLVVHAAVSQPPADSTSLVTDTIVYLNWVTDVFPNLHLALENNHPPIKDEIKVGIQRADVLKIASSLPPTRVGICWDMGHDYLRHQQDEPSPEWLSRVMHVHLHDVDEADLDHYPLVLGNVPHLSWLQGLKQAGMKGIVVLELKGERLKDWSMDRIMAALVGSIETIAKEIQ